MTNLEVFLPAVFGGIFGSLIGILAQFFSFRYRRKREREKYRRVRRFLVNHIEKSISSLGSLTITSPAFKVRGRIEMCRLGDVIEPIELLRTVADAGLFDEVTLSMAFHIRNSDTILNELLANLDANKAPSEQIVKEAITNMVHLKEGLSAHMVST